MKSQLVSMKPLVLTMKVLLLVTSLGLALAVDEFIVGGDDVTQAGKWPWQVSNIIIRNPHEVFLY